MDGFTWRGEDTLLDLGAKKVGGIGDQISYTPDAGQWERTYSEDGIVMFEKSRSNGGVLTVPILKSAINHIKTMDGLVMASNEPNGPPMNGTIKNIIAGIGNGLELCKVAKRGFNPGAGSKFETYEVQVGHGKPLN